MSADNFIIVREMADGRFLVTHNDASTGAVLDKVGEYGLLKDAMSAASHFEDELDFPVEHGIKFVRRERFGEHFI